MLVYLALKRAWVGRAELAAMLWPEQQTNLAYANLRKTLFGCSQSLGPAGSRATAAPSLPSRNRRVRFRSALRDGGSPMRCSSCAAANCSPDSTTTKSEAWSSWLNFERDRLRLAWRNALECLGDIEGSDARRSTYRRGCSRPIRSMKRPCAPTCRWLARGGQHIAQARRAFVETAGDDLGLTPGAELQACTIPSAPSPRGAPCVAPDRPPSADGFIGRTVELRRIGELLAQEDCRLMCSGRARG